MADAPDPKRQTIGRYGGLKSWANTPDRSARTRPARSKSPSSLDYYLNRLDPVRFADASDAQKVAAAEAAKRAYFAGMAMKSVAARRKGVGRDAAA